MSDEIAVYKSTRDLWVTFAVVLVSSIAFYLFISPIIFPFISANWLLVFLVYLGVPLSLAIISFIMGWRQKKSVVEYSSPDWEFDVKRFDVSEIKALEKAYKSEYSRLVANSNYWIFFVPIGSLIFMLAFIIYSIVEDTVLTAFVPYVFSVGISVCLLTAFRGAFMATSNDASEDFRLPLLREAVRLAKRQRKVPGVSSVSVVLDVGMHDDYRIYREPRVVTRISGIEEDSYIESWSDELGAVVRVLCRILGNEEHAQVIWWWYAQDRNFRKYRFKGDEGYYVQHPVPSHCEDLGVKDIELVIKNAVAIIVLEWVRTRGSDESLLSVLEDLGVETDSLKT